MTIEYFLDKLKRIDFDREVLRKYEFSEDDIDEAIKAFTPSKKINYNSTSNDLLIKFIEEYETNFFAISIISFFEEIQETENFIILGNVRGEDFLAIDKRSRQIVTLALWDRETIVAEVATNSESFMKAFLFNGIGYIGKEFASDYDRFSFMNERIHLATNAAGGDKYADFWTHLYPVRIP